jgi:hypothetical protein
MKNLIAFPLLALTLAIQMAIASRMTLLSGSADLMLLLLAAWSLQEQVESAWQWAVLGALMFAFVSGLPPYVPFIGYLLVVALARLIHRRIWQIPSLAMFTVTFAGTLFMQALSIGALQLKGVPLSFAEAFGLVTVPSVLLNLLLALPVYSVVRDLALWVYPVQEMA